MKYLAQERTKIFPVAEVIQAFLLQGSKLTILVLNFLCKWNWEGVVLLILHNNKIVCSVIQLLTQLAGLSHVSLFLALNSMYTNQWTKMYKFKLSLPMMGFYNVQTHLLCALAWWILVLLLVTLFEISMLLVSPKTGILPWNWPWNWPR
jgi:hypothetical protein